MPFIAKFPHFRQSDSNDCGPTCLRIVSKYFGKDVDLISVRKNCFIGKKGVSMAGIAYAAEQIGFETHAAKISLEELHKKAPLPCIVHWNENHFLVVYKISKSFVWISDPESGKLKLTMKDFNNSWANKYSGHGIVMILEPNSNFYALKLKRKSQSLKYLFNYFSIHKKLFKQLFFGLFISTIIQLALPFLTQSIVDYGIENQNFRFVTLIIVGQLFLVLSHSAIEIIRDWILLHISTRVNLKMLSDFLNKLMILPISFFEKRTTGDIIQRVQDNDRIEEFITGGSMGFLFDITNIFLFGIILFYYSTSIFLIFLSGTFIYVLWTLAFMSKTESYDTNYFKSKSNVKNKILQIINGIRDIKLNGSHQRRKNEWYKAYVELFKINIRYLRIIQLQTHGGKILNDIKNIIIVFMAARLVINGDLTLGGMLAIQFIIGELNVPIQNISQFVLSYQKAALSLGRLLEIQNIDSEFENHNQTNDSTKGNISLEKVSLRYGEPGTAFALQDISLKIPRGKVTAIVGPSGSGKTSLLKLLLKFYDVTNGSIKVDDTDLFEIDTKSWRDRCAVVLQDGSLFNDTISNNITESRSTFPLDRKKFHEAVSKANLVDLIDGLPHKANTRIGENGNTLSGGEKQRLLIARAIYKDPEFFFFDEATSSLDSLNESEITKNLESTFEDKTVVIIAHRFSTIKNADNIIVLDKGKLLESGTHQELMEAKSFYHSLFSNQIFYE